jgi:hypothetical protein
MQRHPTPACKAAHASKAAHAGKAAQARIAGLTHDNALLAVQLNTWKEWDLSVCMNVPVVMVAAEQVLAQRVLLVVRMSSLCPI